jgi:hypothetical protein
MHLQQITTALEPPQWQALLVLLCWYLSLPLRVLWASFGTAINESSAVRRLMSTIVLDTFDLVVHPLKIRLSFCRAHDLRWVGILESTNYWKYYCSDLNSVYSVNEAQAHLWRPQDFNSSIRVRGLVELRWHVGTSTMKDPCKDCLGITLWNCRKLFQS